MSDEEAPAYTVEGGELVRRLDTDLEQGLTEGEGRRRLQAHGPNALKATKARPWLRILVDQFRSLVMALLLAAGGAAFAFGDTLEGIAIAVLLVTNVVLGFIMELRASRAMDALRRLGGLGARAVRDGETRTLDARDLVPGDVVVLEAGDVVTADVRILEASLLQADESTFTGESMPVAKAPGTVAAEAPVTERTNMLWKGTTVPTGTARGVVVATGADTELGGIARLVQEAEGEVTPLERRLSGLGRRLILATLVIVVLVSGLGILRGQDVRLMVETGIALAIAAVPEGLPVVATLALARGMLRMAHRNALVRRLAAVETLGSTTVIFTDKTGTLTENRMHVAAVHLPEGEAIPPEDSGAAGILEAALHCTNATPGPDGHGDPMERAILDAVMARGLDPIALRTEGARVREEAFDAATRKMGVVLADGRVMVKGAPEAVLEACSTVRQEGNAWPLDDETRTRLMRQNEAAAAEGLRVLAVAEKAGADAADAVYAGLTWLGLLAFADPAREDVPAAIDACRKAGIQVVMVTGDQAGTAQRIALDVGILTADTPPEDVASLVHSRVDPARKLALIEAQQDAGDVVAMTGDGVNDAPALHKADIGIAMGLRGTPVARESADLVLKDDSFATIVEAIRQGRAIFTNLRRFAYYLLSCNVGEVAVVAVAALAGTALPLLPLQILFLNLVTDVFPALALGFGEGSGDAMERPPRPPEEPILGRRQWTGIALFGALFTVATLGAFFGAQSWLGLSSAEAVTVSFLTLATSQLWHVFNMRGTLEGPLHNDVVRNPYVWGALALSLAAVLAAVYVPTLASVLRLSPPSPSAWGLALGASLLPLAVGQIQLEVRRARTRHATA